MVLKDGFYTALGTPIDEKGAIVEEGLRAQIEQQIQHGASGMLLMGSMGMQPCILTSEAARAAKIASDAVAGRTALFVGAMDNSIARVKERIDTLRGLNIDGLVLTSPYYFMLDNPTLVSYFKTIADYSPYPLYLYDLPVSVKHKITYPMVIELAKHPNIMGIKTADITMIMQIMQLGEVKSEFTPLYSGLDSMDIGCKHGIRHYLDGMFATTPKNAEAMEACYRANDFAGATKHLRNIIRLRDTMAKYVIFPSFTVTMNLLGLKGSYQPDYTAKVSAEAAANLKKVMEEIGEL